MSTRPTWRHVAVGLALLGGSAGAADLVYLPVNPSISAAIRPTGPDCSPRPSATNKHKAVSDWAARRPSIKRRWQQFNQTLERTVLSQLSAAATSKLIGQDGKLVPGTFSTANFIITVTDLGGGMLRVTTTEKSRPASTTSFEVGQ